MASLVEVLAVDQRYEFRVVEVVLPGEANEARQGCDGIILLDLELGFRLTDACISIFQGDPEQVLLVSEIVVQHALVDLGAGGNVIHPCTAQTLAREFDLGSRQDPRLGSDRIAGFACLCHRPDFRSCNNQLVIYKLGHCAEQEALRRRCLIT